VFQPELRINSQEKESGKPAITLQYYGNIQKMSKELFVANVLELRPQRVSRVVRGRASAKAQRLTLPCGWNSVGMGTGLQGRGR
jgi:hypothetical protein